MAEVQDIFGKVASGKVGPVSLYPLRGKTIMRSLRTDKGGPRTENQLRNQRRFKEIRKFCTPFKEILIPQVWNALATTSSGYHLFMKFNSPAFDPEGVLAYPEKICLSMGKLAQPEGIQAKRTTSGSTTIEVQWERDPNGGGTPSKDKLMVISSGGGKYSPMTATGLKRGDLGGTFELPPLAFAATHIYLFFESLDQRYYSESVCLEI